LHGTSVLFQATRHGQGSHVRTPQLNMTSSMRQNDSQSWDDMRAYTAQTRAAPTWAPSYIAAWSDYASLLMYNITYHCRTQAMPAASPCISVNCRSLSKLPSRQPQWHPATHYKHDSTTNMTSRPCQNPCTLLSGAKAYASSFDPTCTPASAVPALQLVIQRSCQHESDVDHST
jgi:hypothetical protein